MFGDQVRDIFAQAIEPILTMEGGYSNDPDDAGGETRFGISKAAYPDLDIANITLDEAKRIYRRDYWDRPGYYKLPSATAYAMLSFAINMGTTAAGELLQRALNHLVDDADLIIDGQLGQRTLAVAARVPDINIAAVLRAEARNHYLRIVGLHPSRRKFLAGWLRRAAG